MAQKNLQIQMFIEKFPSYSIPIGLILFALGGHCFLSFLED